MKKLFAIIKKDCLLLLRDKAGLLVLFILPVSLLILMTMIQSNIDGKTKTLKILIAVQRDRGMAHTIREQLLKAKSFEVTEVEYKNQASIDAAIKSVAEGDHQALIVLSKKINWKLTKQSKRVPVYFDPNLPSDRVDTIKIAFEHILQSIQLKALQKQLPNQLRKPTDWFKLDSEFPSMGNVHLQPSPVQQNVPAWTLFGMFFIVIPLAGQMVRERSEGIYWRLHLAPVSQSLLLFGKSISFLMLNMSQLGVMIAVGIWGFPYFQLASLDIGNQEFSIFLIGICSSLAAIGFGLVIGNYSRSYQQATSIGPFLIVITAAVSGIFVPSYIMPSSFQTLSVYSPMYWAQSSFLNVLVRQSDLAHLYPELGKLIVFFIAMLIVAIIPAWRSSLIISE